MGIMAVKNFIDERAYEIIGGEIYMPPSATLNHNSTIFSLYDIFRDILNGKDFKFASDVDTVLNSENTPRPDFAIISDFSKIADGLDIKGAPDFIAEVLSPSNSSHDFVTKKELYEKHGVKEYWIVDIKNKNIHVHILKDGIYGTPVVYHDYSQEEIDEMEWCINEKLKEQAKITHIISHTFGEEIRVPIAKIFENII